MSDDPPATALVVRARDGDKQAWDALVERYAPLIWSICRRNRPGGAEADDAGQAVWLQLADHLGREGAITATTTDVPASRPAAPQHRGFPAPAAVAVALVLALAAALIVFAVAPGPASAPAGHRTGTPIVVPHPAPGPPGS